MNTSASTMEIARALASHPRMLTAHPSLLWFMCQYLRKFRVRKVGKQLILHSHLPPLNGPAYGRFIREHLLNPTAGPSHAQIGLTNACPQNCAYCYSKGRTGSVMDTATIIGLIQDLKRMGVFWIGFTGGEPLLNKDIVRITESAGEGCVVKLFTTGCTLTRQKALELKNAGLYSVSVSLDHWNASVHDRGRGYEGAFQIAVNAIRIFQEVGGIDVGVSAVLSAEMIRQRQTGQYLEFLETLELNEVWLSEAKPSIPELWDRAEVVTEQERLELCALQDRYNRSGPMTVNYLGHFEGKEHFGCCAGHKMLSVDACGSVNPCVFVPMSFGNVQTRNIAEIYGDMRSRFPTERRCFINENYRLLQKHYRGSAPMPVEDARRVMDEATFTPYARFFKLHYGSGVVR